MIGQDSNAFERLVERVFFSNADSSRSGLNVRETGVESSRSWILLQSLLVQSDQARLYARRLLLRRIAELPGGCREGNDNERIRALLELYPPSERDALAEAFGHDTNVSTSCGDGPDKASTSTGRRAVFNLLDKNHDGVISQLEWDQAMAQSDSVPGFTTPPERRETPTWGPPLSDSPQLPNRQQEIPPVRSPHAHNRSGTSSVGGMDESAATVKPPFTKLSAEGVSVGVQDSISTVAERDRGPLESSLDAWLRSSGSLPALRGPPPEETVPRARSLPPAPLVNPIFRAPGLVLDFGPSGSSAAEDQNRRPLLQMRGPMEDACSTDSGIGGTGLGGGFGRHEILKVGAEEAAESVRRPWQQTASYPRKTGGAIKARVAAEAAADVVKWQRLAQESRRSFVLHLLAELRLLVSFTIEASRYASRWRCLVALARQHELRQLHVLMLAAATEVRRLRCGDSKLKLLALAASLRCRSALIFALAHAGQHHRLGVQQATTLRRIHSILPRYMQRFGLQAWRERHRALREMDAGAHIRINQLRDLYLRAWAGRRGRELAQCCEILSQCSVYLGKRASQQSAAARRVAVAFQRAVRRKQQEALGVVRTTHALKCKADNRRRLGSIRMLFGIDNALRRRLVGALSNWHVAALCRLREFDKLHVQRAVRRAAVSKMRFAIQAWCFFVSRAHRLQRPMAQAIVRTQRVVLRRLCEHMARNQCEQELAVVCTARLHALQSDKDVSMEAARLDFGLCIRAAAERESRAQERMENLALRIAKMLQRRMGSRLISRTWKVWALLHKRIRAVIKIEQLFRKAQVRMRFSRWQKHVEHRALAYLEAQIDCFNSFMLKRTETCQHLLQKCLSDKAASEADAFEVHIKFTMSEWRRLVSLRKLRAMKQNHATRLLVAVLLTAFRKRGLFPWLEWVGDERHAAMMTASNLHLEHVRNALEETKTELRACRIRAEIQSDSLSHEFKSQEIRRFAFEEEVETVRIDYVARMWQLMSSSLQRNVVHSLVTCTRGVYKRVNQERIASDCWRRFSSHVKASWLSQLRAGVAAAAVVQRQDCTLAQRCRYHSFISNLKLAGLLQKAFVDYRQNLFRELAEGSARIAHVRKSLKRLSCICKSVTLRMGFAELRRRLQILYSSAAAVEQHRHAILVKHDAGIRMLCLYFDGAVRVRKRLVFHKFSAAATSYAAVSNISRKFPAEARVLTRAIQRVACRYVAQTLSIWRRSKTSEVVRETLSFYHERSLAARSVLVAERHFRPIAYRRAWKIVRAWKGLVIGPRRLAASLIGATIAKIRWSWYRLETHKARRGHLSLQAQCFNSNLRRLRFSLLVVAMSRWAKLYCRNQRVQRLRLLGLRRRVELRQRRTSFQGLRAERIRVRAVRHLNALLWRAVMRHDIRKWRLKIACIKDAAASKALDKARHASFQQRSDCQRIVGKRIREGAERTSRALLHAWRCSSAVEAAKAETESRQRRMAAQMLTGKIISCFRHQLRISFFQWYRDACTQFATEKADLVVDKWKHTEKLERIRHGGLLLRSLIQRRESLTLSYALNGSWRAARWQTLLRSFDASTNREHRRLRAEVDALRDEVRIVCSEGDSALREAQDQLLAVEDEAARIQHMEASEAQRNDEAFAETKRIMKVVQRERVEHEKALTELRINLRNSEERETAALEHAGKLQEERDKEAVGADQKFRDIQARTLVVEGQRRAALRELAAARNELREVAHAVENRERERGRTDLERERIFGEQKLVLQQQAWGVEARTREAERDAEKHWWNVEMEMEDRARQAKSELAQALADRDRKFKEQGRTMEHQAVMADEQERNIKRLEELLKEQGDQLKRERRDHAHGLKEVRCSVSVSESKSCLLEEQVTALRQQLSRDQSEFFSAERAWAQDRAALLAAVTAANAAPAALHATGSRRSSSVGRRKRVSPLRRSSSSPLCRAAPATTMATLRRDDGAASPLAVGGCSGGVSKCPWHGHHTGSIMMPRPGGTAAA